MLKASQGLEKETGRREEKRWKKESHSKEKRKGREVITKKDNIGQMK